MARFPTENRAIFEIDESRMTRKWREEKRERRKSAVDGNVNNKIIYDRYTMIVINCISAGRQNVPLCEELRFRWPSPTLRVPDVDIFYHGNAIHGQHNLSVFKYARVDKFTYFNINS